MDNKDQRRVLIDPLLMILKSRRVLIALVSLIMGVVIMVVPQLAAFHSEILTLVLALALTLIGGLSIEDAAHAARQAPTETDIHQQVEAAMDAIIDAAFDEMEQNFWYEQTATTRNIPVDTP